MKRRLRHFAIFLLSGTIVSLVTGVAWCHFGLLRAERLAKYGLWAEARKSLDFYMLVHPGGDEARMLYAESLVKDRDLDYQHKLNEALKQLHYISDQSPLAAKARLQEGRLHLLNLYQPARAERAFRRAVELDPDFLEAHILLWKLLDLTGRSHMAEPIVWRVYELSPPEEKPLRLREWFMSQFFPAMATPVFDEAMGFITPENPLSVRTEAMRFIRFRNEEPDSPLGYACLARWFQLEGDPEFALSELRRGEAKMKDEHQHPYYLYTVISLLIDMGELEAASQTFDLWPDEHQSGFEYWLTKARVLHEARSDYAEAVKAYEQALSVWPGELDWTSWNRKADCLARMGDAAASHEAREHAKKIGALVDEEQLRRVRELLEHLDQPTVIMEVSEYYQKLGRVREAGYWAEYAAQLAKTQPAANSAESD